MCIYVYYVYLYNLRSLKMAHSSEDNFPPKLLVGHSGAGDGDDDDVYYYYYIYNIIITNSVAYCLINNNSQWFYHGYYASASHRLQKYPGLTR